MKNLNFLTSEYSKVKLGTDKKTRRALIVCFTLLLLILPIVIYFLLFSDKYSTIIEKWYNVPSLILGVLIFIPLYFLYKEYIKKEFDFWNQFAEKNGGEYQPFALPENEQSIMFRLSLEQKIENVIIFKDTQEKSMRMFTFSFRKDGSVKRDIGKRQSAYRFTVFDLELEETVPHIYLDYRNNNFGIVLGKKLPLPSEFEKSFSVFVPPEYEIEALEIFTPDILNTILRSGIQIDIELVEQQIYFFIDQKQYFGVKFEEHLKALEKNYQLITQLMALLKPKLDRFNFEKIGDKPAIF